MICSLMLDPDESPDFPGDTATALGRPLAAYPFIAARATSRVRRHYVVTGTLAVKSVALQNDAVIIDPPPSADGGRCAAKDMLLHGYRSAREELKNEPEPLELLCVFFSNAPAVTAELITAGVDALLSRPELDGAVSVVQQNRFNPFFARRETRDGLLEPYLSGEPGKSDGDVWYPDHCLQIVRPRCLEAAVEPRPFSWLGRNVLPLKQWGSFPVEYQWQIPSIEFWLKKHGFSDLTPSLEMQPKPQPQLAPRPERR